MSWSNADADTLARFENERQDLNNLYSSNASNVKNFDSNELKTDPSRIDRYGFIHSQSLPVELTENERARNNLEKSREQKWLRMLDNWSSSMQPRPNETLVNRIFKGIPNSLRHRAWFKLLDVEAQKRAQTGVYEKMKTLGRSNSLDLRQIDLDVNRTFRNNVAYSKRYCQRQVQLYNVLAAYSVYNAEIGYCQGMSGVTALLLMYLSDEESTFWALSELMSNTKYTMHGMFKNDFPKLNRFSEKHEQIIEQLLPNVHKKLQKCGITPLLYTTKWFLQCYLDTIPFSLVLRLWDIFMLKGDIVILAMSYNILKLHKTKIKRFDMDSLNLFLKNEIPENFGFDDDKVIRKLSDCIKELQDRKLDFSEHPQPFLIELPSDPFGSYIYRLIADKAKAAAHQKDKQSYDAIVQEAQKISINRKEQGELTMDEDDEIDDEDDDETKSKSEYDQESLLSVQTNQAESASKMSNVRLKKYPSDYDNLNAIGRTNIMNSSLIGHNKETILMDYPKKNLDILNFRKKPHLNGSVRSSSATRSSDHYITTEKILSTKNSAKTVANNATVSASGAGGSSSSSSNNNNYYSIDKNVARIVVHKDNLEYVRNNYGIYMRENSTGKNSPAHSYTAKTFVNNATNGSGNNNASSLSSGSNGNKSVHSDSMKKECL